MPQTGPPPLTTAQPPNEYLHLRRARFRESPAPPQRAQPPGQRLRSQLTPRQGESEAERQPSGARRRTRQPQRREEASTGNGGRVLQAPLRAPHHLAAPHYPQSPQAAATPRPRAHRAALAWPVAAILCTVYQRVLARAQRRQSAGGRNGPR